MENREREWRENEPIKQMQEQANDLMEMLHRSIEMQRQKPGQINNT